MGESKRFKTVDKNDYSRIVVPTEFLYENKIDTNNAKDIKIIEKYLKTVDPNHTVFLTPNNKKKSNKFDFVKFYMSLVVRYTHAGAFSINYNYNPINIDPLLPKKSECLKILNLLKNAKKPCMIIGSQATLSPNIIDELRKT